MADCRVAKLISLMDPLSLKYELPETVFLKFKQLRNQLDEILKYRSIDDYKTKINRDSNEMDMECSEYGKESPDPTLWITFYVDMTNRIGFGYELSDKSRGLHFLDGSQLVWIDDKKMFHYVDKTGTDLYFRECPSTLRTRYELFQLANSRLPSGEPTEIKTSEKKCALSEHPTLWLRFRVKNLMIFLLTNGTLQINHPKFVKLIFCPASQTVRILESTKPVETYTFDFLKKNDSKRIRIIKNHIQKASDMITLVLGFEFKTSKEMEERNSSSYITKLSGPLVPLRMPARLLIPNNMKKSDPLRVRLLKSKILNKLS